MEVLKKYLFCLAAALTLRNVATQREETRNQVRISRPTTKRDTKFLLVLLFGMTVMKNEPRPVGEVAA